MPTRLRPPRSLKGERPLVGLLNAFTSHRSAPRGPVALLFRDKFLNNFSSNGPAVQTPAEPGAEASAGQFSARDAGFRAALEQAKLDAMKELAYGASHEINNPLANIAARAQSLIKREADPDKLKMLRAIHRQAMRAHEMISDLMLFARPPKLEKSPVAVGELLRQLVRELQPEVEERSIELAVSAGGALSIEADRTQLAVAIKALMQNSLEAIGNGGRINATAGLGPGGDLTIAIADTGPGVSEEVREHLFDPFYSGREAGRGLGFGLSKCWRIVTDHGGEVTVESPATGGARFVLRLPAAS